jgi:hypothetical protein
MPYFKRKISNFSERGNATVLKCRSPSADPSPMHRNEAASQNWNLKIPLEKRVNHSVVDKCGRNALKLTCEHLWIQKFFRVL